MEKRIVINTLTGSIRCCDHRANPGIGLGYADEIKQLLEVPDQWTMVALLAVGQVTGGEFRPAVRLAVDEVVTWR